MSDFDDEARLNGTTNSNSALVPSENMAGKGSVLRKEGIKVSAVVMNMSVIAIGFLQFGKSE